MLHYVLFIFQIGALSHFKKITIANVTDFKCQIANVTALIHSWQQVICNHQQAPPLYVLTRLNFAFLI